MALPFGFQSFSNHERNLLIFSPIRSVKNKESYDWIGLMSGSSLDGLDVALCRFSRNAGGPWVGNIVMAKTFDLPDNLKYSLSNSVNLSALQLVQTDTAFAKFSATCVLDFLKSTHTIPMAIASHGHTVFHNPEAGYTTQIGNGGLIAGLTGLPVVSDFRTLDVGLGGQGAPLVPGAERFLFSDYDACLNLGGIANVSFPTSNPFMGFDLAPCNQLLNEVAGWSGLAFDDGGKLASNGKAIEELKSELDGLSFYSQNPPKSLANESIAKIWKPIVSKFIVQQEDVLCTLCHHISDQIALGILSQKQSGTILITGGGAFNTFLMQCICEKLGDSWIIEVPIKEVICFKEAYCFAFLGLKRWFGEINCFADVTGAKKDSCVGTIQIAPIIN